MSQAGLWQQLAARWEAGASPRILVDGEVVDAVDLAARVDRAAGWLLAQGARPGDRIAVQLARSKVFLEVFLGALAAGMVPIPLHLRMTPRELRHVLDDATPRLHVEDAHAAEAALDRARPERLEPPSADAPACVLYTSGTTGRPKGAIILHKNITSGLEILHGAWRWSPSDRLVHTLPLDHVHGLFVALFGGLWAGATISLLPRFDPDSVWDALEEGGTLFMGVPTFYSRLLASTREPRLASARLFTCGSAPLPAAALTAFERRFGHRILERYGMTEIGMAVSNPLDGERRAGAIGRALPGVQVRVTAPDGRTLPPGEIGELRVRSPSVFAGYLNRPDATAEALVDGEMRTGDLGSCDHEGYFVLTGRASELILVGGLNVYPREVEAALLRSPSVLEAAVVGTPDADLGEVPVAILVARPGTTPPEDDALFAQLRIDLSPFKIPRRVRWVDALPRNAMGKVDRRAVAALAARNRVRMARPDEAQAIADRNLAMAQETEDLALSPERALAGVQSVFARDVGAFYLIAERDDQPVGQLMITREWSDWRNTHVWWIQSVYVAPEARGHGVYRSLYEDVRRRATEAGVGGIRLYVDQRNTKAMAVYSALGMDGEHYRVFEQLLPA